MQKLFLSIPDTENVEQKKLKQPQENKEKKLKPEKVKQRENKTKNFGTFVQKF